MNAKNIFGAFSIAIALFFLWPAVFSSWSEVRALKESLAAHQDALKERTDILDKASSEFIKYQAVLQGANGKKYFELVPAKKNTAELLSATQSIAANAGIQVTTIQFGETPSTNKKTVESYETMTMTLEGTGSYSALRSFLDNLESYVRILDVQSIELGQARQEGTLNLKVQASAYFSK